MYSSLPPSGDGDHNKHNKKSPSSSTKKRKRLTTAAVDATAKINKKGSSSSQPDFFDFTLDDDTKDDAEFCLRYRLNGKKKKMIKKNSSSGSRGAIAGSSSPILKRKTSLITKSNPTISPGKTKQWQGSDGQTHAMTIAPRRRRKKSNIQNTNNPSKGAQSQTMIVQEKDNSNNDKHSEASRPKEPPKNMEKTNVELNTSSGTRDAAAVAPRSASASGTTQHQASRKPLPKLVHTRLPNRRRQQKNPKAASSRYSESSSSDEDLAPKKVNRWKRINKNTVQPKDDDDNKVDDRNTSKSISDSEATEKMSNVHHNNIKSVGMQSNLTTRNKSLASPLSNSQKPTPLSIAATTPIQNVATTLPDAIGAGTISSTVAATTATGSNPPPQPSRRLVSIKPNYVVTKRNGTNVGREKPTSTNSRFVPKVIQENDIIEIDSSSSNDDSDDDTGNRGNTVVPKTEPAKNTEVKVLPSSAGWVASAAYDGKGTSLIAQTGNNNKQKQQVEEEEAFHSCVSDMEGDDGNDEENNITSAAISNSSDTVAKAVGTKLTGSDENRQEESDKDDSSDDGGGKIGAVRDLQQPRHANQASFFQGCQQSPAVASMPHQGDNDNRVEENDDVDYVDANDIVDTDDDGHNDDGYDDDDGGEDDDSSVEEVFIVPDAAPSSSAVVPAVTTLSDQTTMRVTQDEHAEEDVEWIATANEVRLPHMRPHCTDFTFNHDHELSINKLHCKLCYCFICDVPVKDCISWDTAPRELDNHCHAHDTNRYSAFWKSQRAARSRRNRIATVDSRQRAATNSSVGREVNNQVQIDTKGDVPAGLALAAMASWKDGTGPFEPNDESASKDPNLTKCRRCGWYNRFFHRNFTNYHSLHPVSFLDWCHKCGRVASDRDFGKLQGTPLIPQDGDIFLGTKELPFRLVAHDPREMEPYEESWLEADESSPEWKYDEAEMQEDLFKHRLGDRPLLSMILASLPIVSQSSMPSTGSFTLQAETRSYVSRLTSHTEEDRAYRQKCGASRDRFFYWETKPTDEDRKIPSVDETEGIFLNKPGDLILLQQLAYFEDEGFCKRKAPTNNSAGVKSTLSYDITATWNKKMKVGSLAVQVYVKPPKSRFKTKEAASFNKLLGAWYDVFPMALSEISASLTANHPIDIDGDERHRHDKSLALPIPPFKVSTKQRKSEIKNNATIIRSYIDQHNADAKAVREELSLECTRESTGLGGTSPVNQGLSNTLRRFFGEVLVEDVVKGNRHGGQWIQRFRGIVSSHRRMRKGGDRLPGAKGLSYEDHLLDKEHDLCYLRSEDKPLAFSLRKSCNAIYQGTTTMANLIAHCENLSHEAVPFVFGLNVELLQFQRQSVQWALERERAGCEAFLWPKLPKVAFPRKADFFYNPIIQTFRNDKPPQCRGGIIAEEMGLGKTIITLALIFLNQPPEIPISGSPIGELAALEEENTWDKELYARTSSDKASRGSILSRGTLVICPVSLVGQWIEEARSKLKKPGLIYPYHGASRKRSPQHLAQFGIVVTTYETLASDATYHAAKAANQDQYCPPLEQVRWWRVVCDESHFLKDPTSHKSQAVMKIVSDHRWVVSGTPVQTSLIDLKNQLKFIGLDYVDEMFQTFQNVLLHTNDQKAKRGNVHRRFRHAFSSYGSNYGTSKDPVLGGFLMLLRTVMIRHAQQQCYRDSSPRVTLMSLPLKTERTLLIDMSEDEKREYQELQDKALSFYITFRKRHAKNLSKHFLLLTSKLMPLRVACAGGQFPLENNETSVGAAVGESSEGGVFGELVGDGKADGPGGRDIEDDEDEVKAKSKQVQFSDFVFESKCKALIDELKRARDSDPSSKSLVFSQFTSSLDYLKKVLPQHGFQYRTLSGDMTMRKRSKALHDFQNDPPTTIFLLSIRAGAVGINLTQANRVFLLEPHVNPAVEAQSIGRVHRLGQKRSVEVVRLIMRDSVETRMMEMLKEKYGLRVAKNEGGDANTDKDETKEEDGSSSFATSATTKASSPTALVGSVNKDKATMLTAEFDLLFGYEPPKVTSVEPVAAAADAEVDTEVLPMGFDPDDLVPEPVWSCFSGGDDSTNGVI